MSEDEYVNDAIDDAIKAACGFPTWRPIESVPIDDDWKNRSYVLMWSDEDGAFVGYALSIHGKTHYSDHPGCVEGNDVRPTHWMPLPVAPASPPDKGQTE